MTTRRVVRSIVTIAFVSAGLMPLCVSAAQQGQQGQQSQQGQQGQQAPQKPSEVPVRLKVLVERPEGDNPAVSIPFEIVVRANSSAVTNFKHATFGGGRRGSGL